MVTPQTTAAGTERRAPLRWERRFLVVLVISVVVAATLMSGTPPSAATADDIASSTDFGPQISNGTNYQNPGWVAAVLHGGSYVCAGSLIDPEWVLTAAHCVNSPSITVRVGANSRFDTSRSRTVDLVRVHPSYQPFDIYSTDIALLRLSQPITDRPWARVAGNTGHPILGQALTVTGWGETFTNSPAPTLLQGGSVIATSSAGGLRFPRCPAEAIIPSAFDDFCFQGQVGQLFVGSCPGDSGGPVFGPLVPNGGGPADVVFGVVSFGSAAGCSQSPYDDVAQGTPRQALWIFDQLTTFSRFGAYDFPVVHGTGSAPVGTIDAVAAQPGGVRVAGWVYDRDTTHPLDVRITVDGAVAATVSASNVRPDVLAAFANGSRRGFNTVVPATRGTRQVCVQAFDAPTRNLVSLGCRIVNITQNAPPLGFLDSVAGQPARVEVAGWSGRTDTAAAVPVHVYVDGVFAGGAMATNPRPDVAQVFPAVGTSTGFRFAVPAAPGQRQVCVFGVNDGPPTALGCRTVSVPAAATPRGFLDTAVRSGEAIRVAGWAGDDANPAPTPVHVYVDGVFAGGRLAELPRADVAAAFPSLGPSTGFNFTVPAGPGPRTVCVFALGVTGPNTALPCRTVAQ